MECKSIPQNELIVMFPPCSPLFAFGNANFPSFTTLGWAECSDTSVPFSPVAPLGQTLPTMKFLGDTESRVWSGQAALAGRHKGWG